LFVAVSASGTGDRVMASSDGITWNKQTSAPDSPWISLAYGNSVFVAVADGGPAYQSVMTSSDGINWTNQTAATPGNWYGVAFGNGIFVAVAWTNVDNRVMTSPNGIDWTSQPGAIRAAWYDVEYNDGVFVAVGSGSHAMRSYDNGVTWTLGEAFEAPSDYRAITYANGHFVAVGHASPVLTSPDGIEWTRQFSPGGAWDGLAYGDNTFIAVSSASVNYVLTSPDGETWTQRTHTGSLGWLSIAFGRNTFAAVSGSGYAMTSGATELMR
jgi:photosystem II stability/assembly factor-like uncharacterized protein